MIFIRLQSHHLVIPCHPPLRKRFTLRDAEGVQRSALLHPTTAFAHCGKFHLLRAPLAGCYISLRFAIDINSLFNCLTCRPPITAECGNFCALPVVREDFRSVEKYLLLLPSLAGSRPNWPNSDLVLLPFFSHTHHWNRRNIFYSIDFEKLFIPLLFQALHTK